MSQQKKNRSEPSLPAAPVLPTTSTPSVPPADNVTTSPPSGLPADALGLKPGPTLPALKRPLRPPQLESNDEAFIILIKSPRGTVHALMNPKAGQGALAVFHSAEAAAAVLTTNSACLNNKSCIIQVGGL